MDPLIRKTHATITQMRALRDVLKSPALLSRRSRNISPR